jgi:hypothetical protein
VVSSNKALAFLRRPLANGCRPEISLTPLRLPVWRYAVKPVRRAYDVWSRVEAGVIIGLLIITISTYSVGTAKSSLTRIKFYI